MVYGVFKMTKKTFIYFSRFKKVDAKKMTKKMFVYFSHCKGMYKKS